MKIPATKQKRSGVSLVVGAIVLVAAGVGGYFALGKKSATPPAPPPVATPVETVRVATNPPPAPPPSSPVTRRNENRRQTAPPPAPPAAAAAGTITVAADPYGEVFIDGTDVGQTPVVEYSVAVGRHTIRVERAGYKTVSEAVQVSANNPVRKRYTLLPE